MTPHDSIIVSLPYPLRFITFPRKIGFTFTNMAMYLFRESTGITTSKDYEKWVSDHGQQGFINEILYHSARAYCMEKKTKENFTRSGLLKAVTLADLQTQQSIMKVWQLSESFGATIKPAKKKVVIR